MSYQSYTHDLIIKNSEEILQNASLIHKGSEKIIDIQFSSKNPKSPQTILIPGLINLHCHLSYTNISMASDSFFVWLKKLVEKIQHLDEGFLSKSIEAGIQEALSFGTTFIVDNSNEAKLTSEAFIKNKMKGLIGLEIFGSNPKQAREIFETKIQELKNLEKSFGLDYALSTHAVYDVSLELWQLCFEWSQKNKKFLLSHIAESEVEELWMQDYTKPRCIDAKNFFESISSLENKIANYKSYSSSADFLISNKLIANFMILTHGVELDDDELKEFAQAGLKLITCPRSNNFLQNNKAKIEHWQKHQIQFGLGTDSKASNHNLNLREEAQNLNLSDKKKFDLLTIEAAKILNKDKEIGSIEKNKYGDYVVLEPLTPIDFNNCDPLKLALDPAYTRVKEVYINNQLCYTIC